MTKSTKHKPRPWDKELCDLTKFDWMTAVGLSHDHKHSPLQLRIANALMQHANDENLAWPSQKTLAQYAGVAIESQVRRAIVALCESGALMRGPISQLDDKDQSKITRNKRGIAYRLNLFWAFEVFEASRKPLRFEPKHLRDGRARKIEREQLHRTTVERSNRTTVERPTPHYDSAPNMKGNNRDQEQEAGNEEGRGSTHDERIPFKPTFVFSSYRAGSKGS
jgi:hypothetical protein